MNCPGIFSKRLNLYTVINLLYNKNKILNKTKYAIGNIKNTFSTLDMNST